MISQKILAKVQHPRQVQKKIRRRKKTSRNRNRNRKEVKVKNGKSKKMQKGVHIM